MMTTATAMTTDREQELEAALGLLYSAVVSAYLGEPSTRDEREACFFKVDRKLRELGVLRKLPEKI